MGWSSGSLDTDFVTTDCFDFLAWSAVEDFVDTVLKFGITCIREGRQGVGVDELHCTTASTNITNDDSDTVFIFGA